MDHNSILSQDVTAILAIDISETIGSPVDRFVFLFKKVQDLTSELAVAKSSCRLAWSEHDKIKSLLERALNVMVDVRKSPSMPTEDKDWIDNFINQFVIPDSRNQHVSDQSTPDGDCC